MVKYIFLALLLVAVCAVGISYYLSTSSLIQQLSDNQTSLINEQTILNNSLNELQSKYDNLQSEYDRMDIKLVNPTYAQVTKGVQDIGWISKGNCCDKSKYVQDYFYDRGLQCYIVISNFKFSSGHISVAFDTTDKGWVYVEPDVMNEAPIKVGVSYYPQGYIIPGQLGTMTVDEFVDSKIVTQLVIVR